MDGIVLCGPTAETLLEHELLTGRVGLEASNLAQLPEGKSLSNLRGISWPIKIAGVSFDSIDVLVPGKQHLRHIPGVHSHCWGGELPPGSIARVEKSLYLTTAPFMALQAARCLSAPNLAQYLMYLAGHYCLHQEIPLQERPPLATLEQISAWRHILDGSKGCKTMESVLPFCLGGTRSPQEVNLLISAVFPRSRCGYGFSLPLVNHRIELDSEQSRLVGSRYLEIDLYWPQAKIGLEYNGIEAHSGGLTPRDISRQYLLKELGIDLIYVTKVQLFRAELLDIAMRTVAKRLRASTRPDRWPDTERVQRLLNQLRSSNC